MPSRCGLRPSGTRLTGDAYYRISVARDEICTVAPLRPRIGHPTSHILFNPGKGDAQTLERGDLVEDHTIP